MANFIKLTVLCGAVLIQSVASGGDAGPVGPIKFHSVGECESPVNLEEFELKIEPDENNNNRDTGRLSFNLASDLNDETLVTLRGHQYMDDGSLQRDAYVFEEKELFGFMNKFIPEIYSNIRNSISPVIEADDAIPAGEYTLENFYADYHQTNVNQVSYGRFLNEMSIIQDGDVIVCLAAEVELTAPETGM